MSRYLYGNYINSCINEGLLDKFKKKADNKQQSNHETNNKNIYDTKIEGLSITDFIIKNIKEIEKKLLTPIYKKKMVEALNKYGVGDIEDADYNNPYKYNSIKDLPTIGANLFEEGIIEIIIDASQDERVALCYVIEDIIKELKKIPELKDISFSTADGDEGCLYF